MKIFGIFSIIFAIIMLLGLIFLSILEIRQVYKPKLEGMALMFICIGGLFFIIFSLLCMATK